MKNRQKIVKKGENRQNTILKKISFKIRFSIKSMKLGEEEEEKKEENRQNSILKKISFKIRFSI